MDLVKELTEGIIGRMTYQGLKEDLEQKQQENALMVHPEFGADQSR